jgi:hypothetical protein
MKSLHKQKGMTAIGWGLVLIIIGLSAIIAIKLIPIYIDGFKVYSSLESLEAEPRARGKPATEIRKLLMKRLDINMVTDVGAEDISITRGRNGIEVNVYYEARRQLFGNLFVVVVFDKTITIDR